jgi:hypothetical protein
MRALQQYRIQTLFALLQSGVILFGSLLTGAIMKSMELAAQMEKVPLILRFVRDWGFLLILIPLAWIALTIRLERVCDWHTKRWTFISGLCLLAALAWFMALMIARAGSTTIHVGP